MKLLDYPGPRLIRHFKVIPFILFLVLVPVSLRAQLKIPEHGGIWVHDEAGLLSPQTIRELEYILKEDSDSTSNQIAVYIIPTLKGEDIDDFAVRVFSAWKLGQKNKDNGVLLLIAVEERKIRIEVGYGLEGVLTDLMSSRINRNEIAPYFKQGDYDRGVKAGVEAIMQVIKGEYVNDNPTRKKRPKEKSPLFTLLTIFLIIFFLSRRRGGRGGGGYWSSGRGWMGSVGGVLGSGSGSWGSGGFGGGGHSGGGGASGSW
jgi:uncharacterized protein